MDAVTVNNVSIFYITGDVKSIGIKEVILKKIRGDYHIEKFWANRNISFSIDRGDMLGIIGKNGAGKSTLLKAVSGVLVPTEGTISVKGNIAALLELTAGFDGNLTVRENTYLRGALLGYTRKFMDEMYGQIIAFAELQDFQDRQFNQLSSGMKSRLAFSIACLVNPDVLILDEVLSVGDGAFRKKSEDKMMEILERGVTGLFVSHSLEQVRGLCNKILWLEKGRQIAFGDEVEKICNCYEEYMCTDVLPETPEDFDRMSESWLTRAEQLRQEKIAKRKKAIIKEMQKGTSEAALEAAIEIIQKRRPDMLNTSLLQQEDS